MMSEHEHCLLRNYDNKTDGKAYKSHYTTGLWYSKINSRTALIAFFGSLILNTLLSGQCLYLSRTVTSSDRTPYGM